MLSIQGGKYALLTLDKQTTAEATAYYNPTCSDLLFGTGRVPYYTNLLHGTAGFWVALDMLRAGELEPCGGTCIPDAPVCKLLRSPNISKPHPDFSPGGFMENNTCRSRPDPHQEEIPCPSHDTVRTAEFEPAIPR